MLKIHKFFRDKHATRKLHKSAKLTEEKRCALTAAVERDSKLRINRCPKLRIRLATRDKLKYFTLAFIFSSAIYKNRAATHLSQRTLLNSHL